MAQKYAWISFICYLMGVAFLIASITVDALFKVSYESNIKYIGSFAYTDPQCTLVWNGNNQISCAMKIDANCKIAGVILMTGECRKFNTIRAFHVMSVIFAAAGLFVHLFVLVSAMTGWRRLIGLLVGEGAAACLIICMVTATSWKDSIEFAGKMEYSASFALVVVAWIFIGISTITLFFFTSNKYSPAKGSSEGVEFN